MIYFWWCSKIIAWRCVSTRVCQTNGQTTRRTDHAVVVPPNTSCCVQVVAWSSAQVRHS